MIELFDDYVILVDQYQYAVGRKCIVNTKDGTQREQIRCLSYHKTLAQALSSLRRYLVRVKLSEGENRLFDALKQAKEIDDKFEEFIRDNLPDI